MRKRTFLTIIAIVAVAVIAVLCLSACEEEYNIDHLEIYSSPKTNYYVGEELDYSGASIRVVYTNGTDRIVPVDDTMISSFNSSVLGPQYIKIYYGNSSVSVRVNVNRYATQSSALEMPVENYDLIQGQPLNLNDSFLVITFADGSVQRVPLTASMCSGYDAGRVGQQEINVRYVFADGEVINALFNVTVSERRISSVSIRTLPTRNVYYLGDEDVSLSGGEIFVTYNNGYTETLPMMTGSTVLEGLEIISFDSSVAGLAVPVELSYYNFPLSYEVTVGTRDVSEYSFDAADIPVQLEGTALNLGDMMFAVTYTNDESIVLRANDENFSDYIEILGYDPETVGEQELVIRFKYGDVVLATPGLITVTVQAKSLSYVRVPTSDVSETNANPVVYLGNVYELAAFRYELVYDNGEIETGSLAAANVEVYDFTGSGTAEGSGLVNGSFVYNVAGERLWLVTYTYTDPDTSETVEFECEYGFTVVLPSVVSYRFTGYAADEALIYFEYIDGATEFVRFTEGLSLELVYDSGLTLTRNLSELTGDETGFGFEATTSGTTGNALATFTYYDVYDGVRKELVIENVAAYIARSVSSITIEKGAGFKSVLAPEENFADAGLRVEVLYADSVEPVVFELTLGADVEFYAAFSFVSAGSVQLAGGEFMFPAEGEYTVTLNSGDITNNTVVSYPDGNGITVTVNSVPDEIIGVFADAAGNNAVDTTATATEIRVPIGTNVPTSYYLGVRYTGTSDGAEIVRYVSFADGRVTVPSAAGLLTGINPITVTYADEGVLLNYTMNISVTDRIPVSITATFPRTEFYYYLATVESLREYLEDIVVRVEYDNNTFEIVQYDSGNITVTNYDWNIPDYSDIAPMSQEVSVTYNANGVTLGTTVTIYLKEALPTSISWEGTDNMYAVIAGGSSFALNELYVATADYVALVPQQLVLSRVIVLNYSSADGSVNDSVAVELQDIYESVTFDPDSFNRNSLAAQGVRLSYLGCVFTVNVKVSVETALESITLNTDRITVIQGGDVDVSGLVLTLNFAGGSYQVPMRKEYFDADELNGILAEDTNPGDAYSVTVSYTHNSVTRTVSVPFTVEQRKLIAIQFKDVKTEFVEHEPFTPGEGGYILALYNNGRQESITFPEDIPLYDGSNPGFNANFYIDISQFDNSEIAAGGKTKQQNIVIYYTDTVSNITATDTYTVYMRDRRYPTVTFLPSNDYDRVYKDYLDAGKTAPEQIAANVIGYSSYNMEDLTFTLWDGKGEIADHEYVLYYLAEDGTRYNVSLGQFPDKAGVYDIVAEYAGDSLHNPVTVTSEVKFTVAKRDLTITFTDSDYAAVNALTKVYGEATDKLYVEIAGLAADEDYADIFATGLEGNYMLVYPKDYSDGLAIFDIVYTLGGNVSDMSDRTAAGTYMINIRGNATDSSVNYNIVVNSVPYVISRRPVKVTAPSVSVTYGESVPALAYTAEQADGTTARGLLEGDALRGALGREQGYDAGTYAITVGTLSNSNYYVEFYVDDPENRPFVTINQRNVYIRMKSYSATYGSDFTVSSDFAEYFADSALQNTENVFAASDIANGQTVEDILGVLTIVYDLEGVTVETPWMNGVGEYGISGVFIDVPDRADNYNVIFTPGVMVIEQRAITVAVDGMIAEYGDLTVDDIASLDITYTLNEATGDAGLMPGDEIELYFGVNIGNITVLTVGNYAITLTGWSNNNYSVTANNANLSVTAKNLSVVIPEKYLTKRYNGRMPSIDAANVLLYDGGEEYNDQTLAAEARDGLSIAFTGASDNVGAYPVTVDSNNHNFNFALAESVSYVITSLPITITAGDYFYIGSDNEDIPLSGADLVYNGTAYRLAARIPEDADGSGDGLQPQYDIYGNPVTDNNNEIMYDLVAVTISVSSVTNAGTYSLTATAFNNANYTLVSADTLTFTLKKKEIYIYIDCSSATADDPYTVIRQYSGEEQRFLEGTLNGEVVESGDFALSDTGVSAVQLGFSREGTVIPSLKDVVYDTSNVPLVYDIVVTGAVDPGNNHELKLAEEYKFILLPRTIQLRIYENALSKTYDGAAPPRSIESNQFDVVFSANDPESGNLAGFTKNMVYFSYTRNERDYRSNSSVGTYSVSVSTDETNYAVSLIQPYQYSITRQTFNYFLLDSAPEKQYDGAGITFDQSDLSLPIPTNQRMPVLRTFAYGVIMDGEENVYVNLMNTASEKLTAFLAAFADVNIDSAASLGAVSNYALTARNALAELRNLFDPEMESAAGFLVYGTELLSAIDVLDGALATVQSNAADNNAGNTASAINAAIEATSDLSELFDNENSYIIFVIGDQTTDVISNTGDYSLITFAHDYNRTLNDLLDKYSLRITAKRLEIHIGTDENYNGSVVTSNGNVLASYGDIDRDNSETPFIPYRIYDPENGVYLIRSGEYNEDNYNQQPSYYFYYPGAEDIPIYIYGNIVKSIGYAINSYQMFDNGVRVYADATHSADNLNGNYSLVQGSVFGNYIIQKKAITLEFSETIDSGIKYGQRLTVDSLSPDAKQSRWSAYLRLAGDEALPYGETISAFNFNDISYTCVINGVNVINGFTTAAGEFELRAVLPGSAAQNYSITVNPGLLRIGKATLNMGYTVSGANEIVKTYGDVLDHNWLVSNIRYTGFVGSDNAGSVTGRLVDSKGNPVPNTSAVMLSSIEWMRIWRSADGKELTGNPGSANYPVGNYMLDLRNSFIVNKADCHYEFDNYELVFPEALYNIIIARKTLNLSPVSYSDGSAIGTYYTGLLLDGIQFEYSGFIAGEDENTLGLPAIKYNTAYCQSSNVGTVRLSSDFITNFADIAKALSNYTLSFSGQATVRAIPIEVYLEKDGGLSALYWNDDSSGRTTSFGPYTVGYKYKVVETEGIRRAQLVDGSMSIVSGAYGAENFRFEVPADMYDALSKYGIDATAINVDEIIGSIAKYGSGDFVPNVSSSPADIELSGTEPLNYMDLYKHSYEEVEDTVIKDDEYYTTYRLTGMNFGTNNYTFSYRPFDVRMVIAVDAILATISKYVDLTKDQIDDFITGDGNGNLTATDAMRREIDFMAFSSYLLFQDANLVIYDDPANENTALANNIIINIMNANTEAISGDMTYLFKMYYAINGALNEVLMDGTLHNSLTFAFSSSDPTEFTLNDTRVLNYSSEDTYAILPVRFFETSSVVTEDPAFMIGGEGEQLPYDQRVDAGTKQNYYTAATAYDIGYFEFSAELPANEGSAVIDILVNGTSFADPKALFIRFRAGIYNKIELIYGTGSDQQIIEYPINYGYIFDGRLHTVEFELQKSKNPYTSNYFTFVARIDGRSGAIINLTTAINAIAAIVAEGSAEQVFAEADSSAGIAFIADNFVLRRVVLTKKGRYDNSGVISTIRDNSDTVLVTGGAIDPATDYSEFSSATLHELFGLRYITDDGGNIIAPSGYTYEFYIDGTPFDIGANVSLACGRHRLEVGIYFGGILIDADELILTVVSMLTDGEISIIEFNDAGDVVTEESEAEFTGMRSIDLADYEADRVNGSLVIASNTGNAQAIVSYNSDTRINYVSAAFTVEPAATRNGASINYPAYNPDEADKLDLNAYAVLFRMELFEISYNSSLQQVNFVLLYLQQNATSSLSGLTYSVIPALELVVNTETTRRLFNSGSYENLPVYTGTDLPLFTVQAFVDKQPSDNYGTGNMVVQFSCNNENGVYSDIATLSPTFGTASPIDSTAVARLGLPIKGSASNNTVTNIILNSDLGAQATMYDIGFGNDIPYTDTKYLSNSGNIYQQYEGTGDDPSTGNSDQPSYFLSDNGRSPTAYRHNGIAGKFSSDADFTIYLSSLYLDKNRGGDKGAYLKKSGNTLTFAYYYVVGKSDLEGNFVKEFFTGSQSITLTPSAEYQFDLKYGTNLDGERDDNTIQQATEPLRFGLQLLLTADTTNPVYYQTLTLTVNGEKYTFYCPLFDDGFAGWTLENAYGQDLHDLIKNAQVSPDDTSLDPYRYITDVVNENYYGSMGTEDFYRLPTFISYIGYIVVETQNIDGIELTPTLGIDYSESAAAITDSPKI